MHVASGQEKRVIIILKYLRKSHSIKFGVQGCPWTSSKHSQAFKSHGIADKAGNSAGV
jgi:hypothetical protein